MDWRSGSGIGCLVAFALIFIIPGIAFLVIGIKLKDSVALGAGVVVLAMLGIVPVGKAVIDAFQWIGDKSYNQQNFRKAKARAICFFASAILVAGTLWALNRENTQNVFWCSLLLTLYICSILVVLMYGKPTSLLGLLVTCGAMFQYTRGFDFSEPDRITIINGIRSTDFTEHLSGSIFIITVGGLVLLGISYIVSAILVRIFWPRA